MNTPGGNAVSVAEHTLALMLSLARRSRRPTLPLSAGKWEKKKFIGQRASRQDARRRRARQHRPRSREARIAVRDANRRARSLRQLADRAATWASNWSICRRCTPQSDYISLHVAADVRRRRACSSREAFARMKTGVRIVNCARGELVDQDALHEAMESGKVAGAGLDVF